MRTPFQAMLWELWRAGRGELLFRTAFQCVTVLFVCGAASFRQSSEPELEAIRGVLVMLLAVGSIASQSWILTLDRQQPGFSFRLGFTRPVSTALLVSVPIATAMLASVICLLIPGMLYIQLADRPLPLGAFSVVVATVVAWLMAASWSPATILGKIIALAGLSLAFFGLVFVVYSQQDDPAPLLMLMGRSPPVHSPAGFGWRWPPACMQSLVVTATSG